MWKFPSLQFFTAVLCAAWSIKSIDACGWFQKGTLFVQRKKARRSSTPYCPSDHLTASFGLISSRIYLCFISVRISAETKDLRSWRATEGEVAALLLTWRIIALPRRWNVTAALIPGGPVQALINAADPSWTPQTQNVTTQLQETQQWHTDVIISTYPGPICRWVNPGAIRTFKLDKVLFLFLQQITFVIHVCSGEASADLSVSFPPAARQWTLSHLDGVNRRDGRLGWPLTPIQITPWLLLLQI